ncbi:hypothetical protein EYF80_058468 [Liparis tanakae]|uniref:Uncharacterized protein n=1 Tax=Liparis tanakae TaxID=230148 RepID=A0A4Z2ESX5_9TELE|nr:hypothetical protein EYF80_058468 [Liparis tanakae]
MEMKAFTLPWRLTKSTMERTSDSDITGAEQAFKIKVQGLEEAETHGGVGVVESIGVRHDLQEHVHLVQEGGDGRVNAEITHQLTEQQGH